MGQHIISCSVTVCSNGVQYQNMNVFGSHRLCLA